MTGGSAPRWMRRMWHAMRVLLRSRRVEQDLHDELAFHLDEAIAAHVARGLDPRQARAAALREFGGVVPIADACRDAWGTRTWHTLLRDAQSGWRASKRTPGTSVAAVGTLALGIGAAAAMLTVVDGVLVRPLPFVEPAALVRTDQAVARGALAVLAGEVTAFDALGTFLPETAYNVRLGDRPERLPGTEVSVSLPRLLGLEMTRGRAFTDEDARTLTPASVIISHRLWRDRFGGRDVVGERLRVDGQSLTIVGVLPAGSLLPLPDADLWLPMVEVSPDPVALWASNGYALVGRLRADATAEDATRDLRRLAPHVRDHYPWRMPDEFGATITAKPLLDTVVSDARARVLLLAAAVSLLLLVACANVATLVMARGVTRTREFSLRTALGATRRRLLQQLLTEALLLWIVGGLAGVGVGWLALDVLRAWLPPDIPRLETLVLDARAVVMALVVTLASGVVFGLLPARHAARAEATAVLRAQDGPAGMGSARQPLLRALVVTQLVCAVVLVSGTLLVTRALLSLSTVDPGLDARDVMAARLTPDASTCEPGPACQPFFDQVLGRMAALPGVETVAVSGRTPLQGGIGFYAIDVEDHPVAPGAPAFTAEREVTSPAYFDVLDIPLARGRTFETADQTSAHLVTVVNQAFAARFWPGQNPIGKRLRYVWQDEWRTIVGVVGDVRSNGPAAPAPLTFYVPYGQEHAEAVTLLVEGRPLPSAAAVRALIHDVGPDVPVSRLEPLAASVERALGAPAALAQLLTAFGVAVVLLGALGTYGVIAGSVAARRREFSIRFALGATARRVVRGVLADAGRLCLLALAIGLPLAWFGARQLDDVFHGARLFEVAVLGGVVSVMALTSGLAALVPALRAASTPPTDALKDA